MSNKVKNSIQNMLDYLSDKLSNKERHTFEKELTQDPFLEDAMDGFAKLSPSELENDLTILSTRLQNRIKKPTSRKLLPYLRIAAGLAIIIGIGSLIVYRSITNISPEKMAETIDVTKGLDSIQRRMHSTEQAVKIMEELKKDEADDQMAQSVKPKSEALPKKSIVLETTISDEETLDETTEITRKSETELSYIEGKQPTNYDEAETDYNESNSEAISGKMAGVATSKQSSVSSAPKSKELSFSIQGSVIDAATNEPIIGASVTSKTKVVVTNTSGNFDFSIVDDSIIQVAYIGYETQQIAISELANKNTVIELEANNLALEEVVVVGYGTQHKKELTGAVSRIESSDITGIPENSEYIPSTYMARAVQIDNDGLADTAAYPSILIKAYKKYIRKNFNYEASDPTKIVVEFMIQPDGTLSDFVILESPSDKFSNEAIRLIKGGCNWEPAILKGEKVVQKITVVIKF